MVFLTEACLANDVECDTFKDFPYIQGKVARVSIVQNGEELASRFTKQFDRHRSMESGIRQLYI